MQALTNTHDLKVKLPPRQEDLWAAIRKLKVKRKLFSAQDLAATADATLYQAENYLRKLMRAGLLSRNEQPKNDRCWDLTTRRIAAPVLNDLGHPEFTHEVGLRVWKALRMGKRMSLTMLQAALADSEFTIPRESLNFYLSSLAQAGWLAEENAAIECGEKIYAVRPQYLASSYPPKIYRAIVVFDPNRNRIAKPIIEAEEVKL